jgi:Fur family peroxide stress response transcriptional regulator
MHMDEKTFTSRQTKYVQAVYEALQDLSHATNLQLLREVQETYPEVSATTIHRVSRRLQERGIIGFAPKSANGSERYDITLEPHHHFMCMQCGRLCNVPDTPAARLAIGQLKKLNDDCAIAGSLTMQGTCKQCVKKEDNYVVNITSFQ